MTDAIIKTPELVPQSIYQCQFTPLNYTACFESTNYIWVASFLAIYNLLSVPFKHAFTNTSLFSTWGTPAASPSDYIYNVWVSRFNWDRSFDSFFNFFEFIGAYAVVIYIAYKMIETWYLAGFTEYYVGAALGGLQFILIIIITLLIILKQFYNYISIQYIYDVQKYVISGQYEAVKFYPFWDFQIYVLLITNPETGVVESSDN